jgi:hypothetical protein
VTTLRSLWAALAFAVLAFRAHRLGWRVRVWTLPAGDRPGADVRVWYADPTPWPELFGHPGWGVSSRGESWPQRWASPLDAMRSELAAEVARRAERVA